MDIKQLDEFAKEIIFEAGKNIRAAFSYNIEIETKSNPNDLVTNIDRETELFFIERIKAFNPDHRILGEEGMGETVDNLKGVVWIIDPIDGTMNFVKQHRHFMITIGIYVDGVGVLGYIFDVMREDLFNAIAGVGAWYNDSPLRKLQPVKIEEAVIGINANWVTPNTRINHEKIIELVQTVRGTRSYGSAAMEIAFVVSGKFGCLYVHASCTLGYRRGSDHCKRGWGGCHKLGRQRFRLFIEGYIPNCQSFNSSINLG